VSVQLTATKNMKLAWIHTQKWWQHCQTSTKWIPQSHGERWPKNTWKKRCRERNADSRFQGEDEGDSTGHIWMENGGLWPVHNCEW